MKRPTIDPALDERGSISRFLLLDPTRTLLVCLALSFLAWMVWDSLFHASADVAEVRQRAFSMAGVEPPPFVPGTLEEPTAIHLSLVGRESVAFSLSGEEGPLQFVWIYRHEPLRGEQTVEELRTRVLKLMRGMGPVEILRRGPGEIAGAAAEVLRLRMQGPAGESSALLAAFEFDDRPVTVLIVAEGAELRSLAQRYFGPLSAVRLLRSRGQPEEVLDPVDLASALNLGNLGWVLFEFTAVGLFVPLLCLGLCAFWFRLRLGFLRWVLVIVASVLFSAVLWVALVGPAMAFDEGFAMRWHNAMLQLSSTMGTAFAVVAVLRSSFRDGFSISLLVNAATYAALALLATLRFGGV